MKVCLFETTFVREHDGDLVLSRRGPFEPARTFGEIDRFESDVERVVVRGGDAGVVRAAECDFRTFGVAELRSELRSLFETALLRRTSVIAKRRLGTVSASKGTRPASAS
jgi:hypothetical protein